MVQTFLADIRFGARVLRQAPVFGAIAVLALALGIGANTAIFSSVNNLLLKALPYHDPERLAMVWEEVSFAGFPRNTPAPANYFDWKEQNTVFTDLAATRGGVMNLTGDGPPEQVLGRRVTANFFDVLGVQPLIGRPFTTEEDKTNPNLVVISYNLWQRRYAGDPSIVNRTILMNGTPCTVLGVMPREFVFINRDVDYWTPIHFSTEDAGARTSHFLNVVGRLKPGIKIERAREEMSAIAKRLQEKYSVNRGIGAEVVPLREELLGRTRMAVIVLMAASGFVLLIACANLASLLLARAVARQREMAVRASLGAGRARLVRQLLTEGLLLSSAGGVLGLCVARAAMTLLSKLSPQGFGSAGAQIDPALLLFTLAVSLATGVLFSIVPAIQISRTSLSDALRQGGRAGIGGRRGTTRDILVVLEVAAAIVLLAGAGLMLHTMAKLRAIDIGFRPDHLLTLRSTLPRELYNDPARRLSFYNRVVDGVRELPGVEGAAYNSVLPFLSAGNTQAYQVEGRELPPGEAGDALLRVGTNDYLKILGVHLVEGRLPESRDGAGAPPVIVVNETLARRFWPHESALGHRIAMSGPPVWRTIIGVVHDVRERGYDVGSKPGVYIPFVQFPDTWAVPESLVVRTAGDPNAIVGAVRRIISSVDPQQPVIAVRIMDEILDQAVQDRTLQMELLGAFAGLALLLASTGLYGVLSYLVTQRGREIGLRMALGASASSVVAMVVGRGLALTGAGLFIGLAAAAAATRGMRTLLYGVDAIDPATFAGVSVLLIAVAAVACWVPARRASLVDPIIVLREE
ncbi:MAG TPA: ABC transporter permease [Bryobacteraceae bacterium]|nr:ABC transporter permease [Bryobacteraceae bacterium]